MHSDSSFSGKGLSTVSVESNDETIRSQIDLLEWDARLQEFSEVSTTPIFTFPVLKIIEKSQSHNSPSLLPQYGLLAGLVNFLHTSNSERTISDIKDRDPRVFFNIAAPSSTFICGSQGSGKSHTLSCLLENCLSSSIANELPSPLTGLVFHYDTFVSDEGGSPCEAAFLSSTSQIKVRVLCSPSNLRTIQVCLLPS